MARGDPGTHQTLMSSHDILKAIPSVDEAIRYLEGRGVLSERPRPLVVRSVRAALEKERKAILAEDGREAASIEEAREAILGRLEREVERSALSDLVPVINATGVVVHTNLGRAPLSQSALDAVTAVARGYSNLEYDLTRGKRGKRDFLVRDALCELTGAEDALVVNNNAAAVLLALNTLAEGREVIVSRSELIEIGGSFRLPEVFEKSGTRMAAVGTTNRTHVSDVEGAIRGTTGAIMAVHWSNYEIVGFVERVGIRELAQIGGRRGIPVIHDLGSGILVETDRIGLRGEMTVAESVKAGATVSTFSGDKLLGGPQAGIAVGTADVIGRMRANPLTRALRPGKLTLGALQATLAHYLEDDALAEIPVLARITEPVESLRSRADALASIVAGKLGDRASVATAEVKARVGGGAAPEREIPSVALTIAPRTASPSAVAAALLETRPAVIVLTREDGIVLDLRTVAPSEEEALLAALVEAFEER